MNMSRKKVLVIIIILHGIFFTIAMVMLSNSQLTYAQHHGAPPPMAMIGDRSISMDLVIEPVSLASGQDVHLKMNLIDEKTGQTIQHVTYRITISKDAQLKLSEFFHSHTGDLTIMVRNSDSSYMAVGGTFDVLTNAIVPDPSGKIVISGPIFSKPGKYDLDVEITTIDNDKTDLQIPLVYHFVIEGRSNNSSLPK